MKFQLETAPGKNLFTAYGAGYVAINNVRHERALVISGDAVQFEWPAQWDDLAASHFEFLRGMQPEIVLLGTGPTQRFPSPALSRCLFEARIGFEVMATPAVCRTYNILAAEGRNVVAALWLP
jgi:uncharacterized protein